MIKHAFTFSLRYFEVDLTISENITLVKKTISKFKLFLVVLNFDLVKFKVINTQSIFKALNFSIIFIAINYNLNSSIFFT